MEILTILKINGNNKINVKLKMDSETEVNAPDQIFLKKN